MMLHSAPDLPSPPLFALGLALTLAMASGCATDANKAESPASAPEPAPAPRGNAQAPASAPASAPESAPTSAPEPAPLSGKAQAPVAVRLAALAATKAGHYTATLSVQALSDIPRAVARIVLPEGVKLVEGKLERDLGALAKSTNMELVVTLKVPEGGAFVLAGGVDCHMASGVKLHGGTLFTVGAPAKTEDAVPVVKDAELGGIRMAPAAPPSGN